MAIVAEANFNSLGDPATAYSNGGGGSRETGVVLPGEPATLACGDGVQSGWQLASPPALGYLSYWARVDTADAPVNTFIVSQIWTVSFTHAGKLLWNRSTNQIGLNIDSISDVVSGPVLALDKWHFIQQIVDFSGTTYTCNARVNGTVLSPASRGSMSADTAQFVDVGMATGSSEASKKVRFCRVRWGSASSINDWEGAGASVAVGR